MGHFLVERYVPAVHKGTLAEDAERLGAFAGDDPRLLLTLYSAVDECCLHVFSAASAAVVELALRESGLVFDRVASVIAIPSRRAQDQATPVSTQFTREMLAGHET
jgi:hypothetical protein